MPPLVPEKQRLFAIEVVKKLRDAGYAAYWAGGCVRDRLLGRLPADYDVASDATPPEIRQLFGRRRTFAVGAAFGVINVLGPRGAGQIEVATFRRDDSYTNGRRPDSVTFSTAQEDASRRDFTINGLFYDPLADEVIDYVGGRDDLENCVIRAIGNPDERFTEDKLRLLRAVRFAATFEFALEAKTFDAVCRMAAQISVVSSERIAEEMRRLLVDPNRARGIQLLVETGLADAILPEIVPHSQADRERLDLSLDVMDRLEEPSFPLTMAALLQGRVGPADAIRLGERLRFSNKESQRISWLLEHHGALEGARSKRWSATQKLLTADGADDLLDLAEAAARAGAANFDDVAWCRSMRARPPEELDPPPLVTGHDLICHGIKPGPKYRMLLDQVRDAQLDEEVRTKEEALGLVDRLLAEDSNPEHKRGMP
jgi:poly(A) polymerase